MEKMLTSTKDEFAKVLKINPPESETLEQDLRHEAFHYQRVSPMSRTKDFID